MTELDQYKAHVAMLTECLQTFIDEHEECTDADDWMASMCSLEAVHVASETLSNTPADSYEEVKKLRDEISKLQAERDALAKDAERYHVLRDSEYQLDEDDPSVLDSFFNQYFGDELDKAVDELQVRLHHRRSNAV